MRHATAELRPEPAFFNLPIVCEGSDGLRNEAFVARCRKPRNSAEEIATRLHLAVADLRRFVRHPLRALKFFAKLEAFPQHLAR